MVLIIGLTDSEVLYLFHVLTFCPSFNRPLILHIAIFYSTFSKGVHLFVVKTACFAVPPAGHVLMLWLLGGGVKDTLATVNLHTDVQLKVNISLSWWTNEAAIGRCARPALTEQLTDSSKA